MIIDGHNSRNCPLELYSVFRSLLPLHILSLQVYGDDIDREKKVLGSKGIGRRHYNGENTLILMDYWN